MKKILITGSRGFLGKHLTELLKEKYKLLTPSKSRLDVCSSKDFNDYVFYHQPDCIIHLAAVCGGIGANQKSPADFSSSI